ncbi:response regulator [Rhizorhabdus argentea]|uniref:response regulator n=1 Tax=Rhizorhabdus argentea TaxID=1387174 RepID=UPI0030EC2D06
MRDALSILYVDDEPDIRLIVEMSLKLRPDIEVRTADSGEQAIAMLQGGDWRPNLVMVDVMMPGMTGPDFLAMLRNDPDTAELPVIFVTARARQQDIAEYIKLGAKGVITKPFDPIRLADQVIALAH